MNRAVTQKVITNNKILIIVFWLFGQFLFPFPHSCISFLRLPLKGRRRICIYIYRKNKFHPLHFLYLYKYNFVKKKCLLLLSMVRPSPWVTTTTVTLITTTGHLSLLHSLSCTLSLCLSLCYEFYFWLFTGKWTKHGSLMKEEVAKAVCDWKTAT